MFRAPLAKSEQSLVPLGQVPSASHKSPDPHRTNSVFKTLNNRLASTSGFLLNHAAERWPSGRRRTPGKCVGGKPSRGFESLPLRHYRPFELVQATRSRRNFSCFQRGLPYGCELLRRGAAAISVSVWPVVSGRANRVDSGSVKI